MILYITVLLLAIMQHPKTLKGLGNEADFLGFLHKLVPPLHYLSSHSDFGFEFAKIFV